MTRLRVTLGVLIAVGLLLIAGTGGYLARGDGKSASPSASSVDAGFARDMSVHHNQAIQMANYARDNTTDASLKILARDIETEQYFQYGQMQGWLQTWGLSPNSTAPAMLWMGGTDHLAADGLMPGMATQTELNRLETLTGKALEIDFLQLMIRHHQGGVTMAQYAETHASTDYVRLLAGQMVSSQGNEIIQMEQTLRQLGSSPLPAPVS